MSKREKTLGILVAVCVVLAAGRMLYRQVSDLKEQRQSRLLAAERKLGETRAELAVAEQAAATMAACQRRSLPTDRAMAQVLYKKWLHNQLSESNITGVNVTSTTSATRSGQWQQIAFNVTGRGTLEQTAKFLFGFYQADFLHKLRSFSMSPIKDSKQLDLSFAIEAIALEGADSTESLPDATSTRLAYETADDYVKTIAGRSLFTKYTPPAPPRERKKREDPDKLDAAREVYVTGLFNNGANSQVWLNVRTTGRMLRLAPGEEFEVEGMQGTVKSIHFNPRGIVIATGGKEYRIALGRSLRDGAEVGNSGG